jgi:hypothetical protein
MHIADGADYKRDELQSVSRQALQGLGRVVKEPSTIVLEGQFITTSLPHVRVILERKFDDTELIQIPDMGRSGLKLYAP